MSAAIIKLEPVSSRLRATRSFPSGTKRFSAESMGRVKSVSSSAAGTASANPNRPGRPFEISLHFDPVNRPR